MNKAQLERWDNPKIRSRQPWRNFLARHSGRPADSITFPDFDAPPPGRQQPRPSPSSSAGRQRLYPDHQRGGTPVSGGRAASAAAGASSSPAGTLAADDGSLTPHNSGGHAKDLNAVGMKALCMVEGIGKGTAKRVLTSRPFSDWDDFVVTMARQGVTSVQLLALRQAGFVVGSSSAVIAGGSASSSSRLTPPAYSPASPSELESGPQRNGGGSARGGGRWRHRQQQSGPGRRQRMYGDAAGERSPGSGGESHAATPGAGPPMSSP